METKELIIVGLGVLGWIWGIVQFVLKRKYQKEDKALEKRFDVYLNFMNQMDEMNLNMRNDPKMIYGIDNELMSKLLSGDEEKIDNALLKFNKDLLYITEKSLQPLMIVSQELNKLKLVASKNLLPKINDYKLIVNDYTNDFQTVLNKMSHCNDLEKNAEFLQNISHEERLKQMNKLWQEIEELMREEIGYYKN